MNKLKKLLITTVAIVGFSTNLFSFEGFSVGAAYSNADFTTKGKEMTPGATGSGSAGVTSAEITRNGSADIGSVFAEYTFAQGSTIGFDFIDFVMPSSIFVFLLIKPYGLVPPTCEALRCMF